MADPIKQAEEQATDTPGQFSAQVLPPGSAPKSKTHEPMPIDETPGQADNPLANRQAGKEPTMTSALNMPGATSGSVHQGIGHPGQGQSSNELKHDQAHRAQTNAGPDQGGTGMSGDIDTENRRLQEEHTKGPLPGREHDATVAGTESNNPPDPETVAKERSSRNP